MARQKQVRTVRKKAQMKRLLQQGWTLESTSQSKSLVSLRETLYVLTKETPAAQRHAVKTEVAQQLAVEQALEKAHKKAAKPTGPSLREQLKSAYEAGKRFRG